MFEAWESFYLLVGGGAGALIGTMFVVATLMADLQSSRMSRGAQIYITPVVFHFGAALIISILTAVPHISSDLLSLLLGIGAVIGAGYSMLTAFRLLKMDWDAYTPDLSDKFFYGIAPILIYVALGYAAWLLWSKAEDAPYAIGWVALVLLAVGVRNAWDLARALVQQQAGRKPDEPAP